MKIAVSAAGRDLNSQIDPRFGRCAFFLVVDSDSMEYESFENGNIALGGGAGIQSAQFVASKGVEAVLTGNCGPNAARTLSAAGIEVYTGQSGRIKDAIERFSGGELRPSKGANVADHFGMGGGQKAGRGMGMGRGMGGGLGRGGGRGMGAGMGRSAGYPGPGATDVEGSSRREELDQLKKQASTLAKQLEEIEAGIKKLSEEE